MSERKHWNDEQINRLTATAEYEIIAGKTFLFDDLKDLLDRSHINTIALNQANVFIQNFKPFFVLFATEFRIEYLQ